MEKGLVQLTDIGVHERILKNYFVFPEHPGIKIDLHAMYYDDFLIGYVATELYGIVASCHMYLFPEYHTKKIIEGVLWIFDNVYIPLLKARDFICIVSNCDAADEGTTGFFKAAGFNIKRVTVAEYPL